MKKVLHRFGSVFMAALLLFSTLSFTVDMHFCGHTLVDIGLYHEAEGCGMAMDDSLTSEMGCCSDLEIVVAGQDHLEKTTSAEPVSLAFSWVFAPNDGAPVQHPNGMHAFIPHREYSPPLLVRDIALYDQVFLI